MVQRAAIDPAHLRAALAEFDLADATVEPLGRGLINETFAVHAAGGEFVLQRVHPVFAPEIHDNIEAVTRHLQRRGFVTPVLVPTRGGTLWSDRGEAGIWRVLTRVPGVSLDAIASPRQAFAAAGLLARFHAALADLDHRFVGMRSGVHDTAAHLARLREAVAEHRSHPLYAEVAAIAERIERSIAALARPGALPVRVVHGDPKFNNVLFAGASGAAAEHAAALVDLDTVGPMELHLELGDMWRSWCNLGGEDARAARFDRDVFEASLAGYAAGPLQLDPAEREALVLGLEWITVELAARFAADALHESYFGWDPSRFASRGAHNLVRAQGQLALHEQVVAARSFRADAIARAF